MRSMAHFRLLPFVKIAVGFNRSTLLRFLFQKLLFLTKNCQLAVRFLHFPNYFYGSFNSAIKMALVLDIVKNWWLQVLKMAVQIQSKLVSDIVKIGSSMIPKWLFKFSKIGIENCQKLVTQCSRKMAVQLQFKLVSVTKNWQLILRKSKIGVSIQPKLVLKIAKNWRKKPKWASNEHKKSSEIGATFTKTSYPNSLNWLKLVSKTSKIDYQSAAKICIQISNNSNFFKNPSKIDQNRLKIDQNWPKSPENR